MQKESIVKTVQDEDKKTIKKRVTQSTASQSTATLQNPGNTNRLNPVHNPSKGLINPSTLQSKTREELVAFQERGRGLLNKRISYKRPPRTNNLQSLTSNDKKTSDQLRMEKMQRSKDIKDYLNSISYSKCYYDNDFKYRHVILPNEIARWIPHHGLLSEEEWRALGVSMSVGWEHYMVHAPEPHILLFKRKRNDTESVKTLQNEQSEKRAAENNITRGEDE